MSHGATGELGHEAVKTPTTWDLALDGPRPYEVMSFYGGLNHKLTGIQEAHVIRDVIA